jgi:uncharacterized protein (TIGR00369 family)
MTTAKRPSVEKEDIIEFARHFPFFKLLGIEVLDVRPGFSKLRLPWRSELNQPAGILHGGVMASVIDTGIAHALLMTGQFQELSEKGGHVVSIDLRVKYLRPVSSGAIVCESTIVRPGRRIIHASSAVTNEAGKEVALGDSIYMAVSGEDLKVKEGA